MSATPAAPQAPLTPCLMILTRTEIARLRVSKHIERQYRHPAFTNGIISVLVGFKRALPGPDSKRVQILRRIGDVERIHLNAEQLRGLEQIDDSVLTVTLGEPAVMSMSIMSWRTHKIAVNKVRYGVGTDAP